MSLRLGSEIYMKAETALVNHKDTNAITRFEVTSCYPIIPEKNYFFIEARPFIDHPHFRTIPTICHSRAV